MRHFIIIPHYIMFITIILCRFLELYYFSQIRWSYMYHDDWHSVSTTNTLCVLLFLYGHVLVSGTPVTQLRHRRDEFCLSDVLTFNTSCVHSYVILVISYYSPMIIVIDSIESGPKLLVYVSNCSNRFRRL